MQQPQSPVTQHQFRSQHITVSQITRHDAMCMLDYLRALLATTWVVQFRAELLQFLLGLPRLLGWRRIRSLCLQPERGHAWIVCGQHRQTSSSSTLWLLEQVMQTHYFHNPCQRADLLPSCLKGQFVGNEACTMALRASLPLSPCGLPSSFA